MGGVEFDERDKRRGRREKRRGRRGEEREKIGKWVLLVTSIAFLILFDHFNNLSRGKS